MNDWAEYEMREFGFDWSLPQPERVSVYYNSASSAGLYTRQELAGVNGRFVLSEVDQSTNEAVFTIGLEDSSDLQDFDPLILSSGQISVDGDGKIRVEVVAPAGKKFYRAGLEP